MASSRKAGLLQFRISVRPTTVQTSLVLNSLLSGYVTQSIHTFAIARTPCPCIPHALVRLIVPLVPGTTKGKHFSGQPLSSDLDAFVYHKTHQAELLHLEMSCLKMMPQ